MIAMKKIMSVLGVLAVAAIALSSCAKNELNNGESSHNVVFTAALEESRTSVAPDGSVDWTISGGQPVEIFNVYENGVKALSVGPTYNVADKTVTIDASFSGQAPAGAVYFATVAEHVNGMNPKVDANQEVEDDNYDPTADVLVSKTISGNPEFLKFSFARVVAFAKMTLKNMNLAEGDFVSTVTVTSDKDLTAEFDIKTYTYLADGGKSITIEALNEPNAQGNVVISFVSVPVENATFTLSVLTDKGRYFEKTFASVITLPVNKITPFGVDLTGCEKVKKEYYEPVTAAQPNWAGHYLIVYETDKIAFNGSLATLDAVSNTKPVTIVNGKIEATTDMRAIEFVVAPKAGTGAYSLKSASGFYIAGTTTKAAASNGLKQAETDADYEIYFSVKDGVVTISSQSSDQLMPLKYNNTSNQTRFRFYKSGQQDIALYKFTGEIPVVAVTGVELNKTSVELNVSATEQLAATVNPMDATNKNVLWSSSNNAVATVENGLVTAVAEGEAVITVETEDGGFKATCNVKVAGTVKPLSSMDEIFAAATAAGTTATECTVALNNYVVTGVKNSNVYVTDNAGKGFIVYASGHGFVAGDILSGTVNCKVQLYKASAELTALTSTTAGITVTKGGVATPQTIAIADLSGVNTGAVVKFAELKYNGSVFTDGTNTITPYNTFMTLPTLINGRPYEVTGVYIQYDTTREIAPRTAADIVAKDVPMYDVTVAEGIQHGTVTVDPAKASEGETVTIKATPDSGYTIKSLSAVTESGSALTIAMSKFTMPAEKVIVSAEFEESQGGDPVTVSMSTFTAVEGNVGGDTNVTYKAEKGTAATAPAINNGQIRIYQNGGKLTVSAQPGFKLQTVTIGSAMNTTIDYASTGASATGVSLASGKTLTAEGVNDTSIVFTCKGTTSSTRLYLNSLSVTYVAE